MNNEPDNKLEEINSSPGKDIAGFSKERESPNFKVLERNETDFPLDYMPKQSDKGSFSTIRGLNTQPNNQTVNSEGQNTQNRFKKSDSKDNNMLQFTFKNGEEKPNEIQSKDLIKSQENAYILETENNLRLFEKKFEEFQKNSLFSSSSNIQQNPEINLSPPKIKIPTPKNSLPVENTAQKKEVIVDCPKCKNKIDNLLIELNTANESLRSALRVNDMNEGKIERYFRQVEDLYQELQLKENSIMKLNEELKSLRTQTNVLKRESQSKVQQYEQLEIRFNKLSDKLNSVEYEKGDCERKMNSLEFRYKSLKADYENTKNLNLQLKKEREKNLSQIDDLKSINYQLEQAKQDLKNEILKNEKTLQTKNKEIFLLNNQRVRNTSAEERQTLKKIGNQTMNNFNRKSEEEFDHKMRDSRPLVKNHSEERFYSKNKEFLSPRKDNPHQKEMQYESKLSELLRIKARLENDILKLPSKQRTLHQINSKLILEEDLKDIEREIGELRLKTKSIMFK